MKEVLKLVGLLTVLDLGVFVVGWIGLAVLGIGMGGFGPTGVMETVVDVIFAVGPVGMLIAVAIINLLVIRKRTSLFKGILVSIMVPIMLIGMVAFYIYLIESQTPKKTKAAVGRSIEKEDSCEEYQNIQRDTCYWNLAVDNKDQTKCELIVNEVYKENCISEFR